MSNKISRLSNFKKNVNKNIMLKSEKLLDLETNERIFISHIDDKDTTNLENNEFYSDYTYPHSIKSFKILSLTDNKLVINTNISGSNLDEYYISSSVFISAIVYNIDNLTNSFINNSHVLDSTINSGYIGVYSKNVLDKLTFESINNDDSDITVIGKSLDKTYNMEEQISIWNSDPLNETISNSAWSQDDALLTIEGGSNKVYVSNLPDEYKEDNYEQTYYTSTITDSIYKNGTFKNLNIKSTTLELYDPDDIDGPIIKGGKFYNCIISGYRIEGGEFYNCILDKEYTVWVGGKWIDTTRGWNLKYLIEDSGLKTPLINELIKRDIPNVYNYPYKENPGSGEFFSKTTHLFYPSNINKFSFVSYMFNSSLYDGTDYSVLKYIIQNSLNYPMSDWNGGYCVNGNLNLDNWYDGTIESDSIRIDNWYSGTSKTPSRFIVNVWHDGLLDGGSLDHCNVFKSGIVNNGILDGCIIAYENIDSDPILKSIHTSITSCTMNGGNLYYCDVENCTLNKGIMTECNVSDICEAHGASITNSYIKTLYSDNNTYVTNTDVTTIKADNTNFDNVTELQSGLITESIMLNCNFTSKEHRNLVVTATTLDRCSFNENLKNTIYTRDNGTTSVLLDELTDEKLLEIHNDIFNNCIHNGLSGTAYRELDLKNNTIKNSLLFHCNLFSNNISNSYVYYCDFYGGILDKNVFKDGNWSSGILRNVKFIDSTWISGSYEDWVYIDTLNPTPEIPEQQKRIEAYVK